MWKSACVGIYQLLNWKMQGETLKFEIFSNVVNLEYMRKPAPNQNDTQ